MLTLSILSLFSISSLSLQANKIDLSSFDTIIKIGGLGLTLGAGYHLHKLNKQYTKEEKRPDTSYRIKKILGGAALVLLGEVLFQKNPALSLETLAKLGAIGISTTLSIASRPILKEIPFLNGALTDTEDKDGNEIGDISANTRFAVCYIPLRQIFLHLISNNVTLPTE